MGYVNDRNLFSQFWRLKVRDWSITTGAYQGFLHGLQLTTFLVCVHDGGQGKENSVFDLQLAICRCGGLTRVIQEFSTAQGLFL